MFASGHIGTISRSSQRQGFGQLAQSGEGGLEVWGFGVFKFGLTEHLKTALRQSMWTFQGTYNGTPGAYGMPPQGIPPHLMQHMMAPHQGFPPYPQVWVPISCLDRSNKEANSARTWILMCFSCAARSAYHERESGPDCRRQDSSQEEEEGCRGSCPSGENLNCRDTAQQCQKGAYIGNFHIDWLAAQDSFECVLSDAICNLARSVFVSLSAPVVLDSGAVV